MICVGIVRPEMEKVPEAIDLSKRGSVLGVASCNVVPFHPSILTA
jgi:hypothetical protein